MCNAKLLPPFKIPTHNFPPIPEVILSILKAHHGLSGWASGSNWRWRIWGSTPCPQELLHGNISHLEGKVPEQGAGFLIQLFAQCHPLQHSLHFYMPRTSREAWAPLSWALDPNTGKSRYKNEGLQSVLHLRISLSLSSSQQGYPWRKDPDQLHTSILPQLRAKLSSRFTPFSYSN